MLKSKLALVLAVPFAVLMVGCSNSDNPYAPVEAPEVNNIFSLNEVWSTSGDSGVKDFFSELNVAFKDNVVYVPSRSGKIRAYDKHSGNEIWSVDLSTLPENEDRRSARISGGVAISGQYLALGSENGYIYLLSVDNGAILWSKYVGAEVVARPVFSADGSRLFVLDGRGNFAAYDVQNKGEQLWVTGDAPQSLRLRAQSNPVAIGNEFLLVGTSSGKVNVILQENGSTVNQIEVGQAIGSNALERVSDVAGSPLMLGAIMYASSFSGGLIEYDFGTFNYNARLGYQSAEDMAFDENSLIITSTDGTVYCLNLEDNSQRWANTELAYRNVTAPTIYGDYAVVGDYEGYMYFMDLKDGSIDYMDRVDRSGLYVAPQVEDGNLYVLARDGNFSVYNFADGNKQQRAREVERAIDSINSYRGAGLSLNRPGVFESGIYAPESLTQEQLTARREAIKKAVAAQEAQVAAHNRAVAEAQRARAEYEAKVKAYEEERRERLSGFGIAAGIRSDIENNEELEDDTVDTDETEVDTENNAEQSSSAAENADAAESSESAHKATEGATDATDAADNLEQDAQESDSAEGVKSPHFGI